MSVRNGGWTKETVFTLKPLVNGPTIKVTDGPNGTIKVTSITGIECEDSIYIPTEQVCDLLQVLKTYSNCACDSEGYCVAHTPGYRG